MPDFEALPYRLRVRSRHVSDRLARQLMHEGAAEIERLEAAAPVCDPALEPMSREHLIESMRAHGLEGAFKVPWIRKKLGL